MLVLSRKPGETIVINGDIVITILDETEHVMGTITKKPPISVEKRIKIGIQAPSSVPIVRGELLAPT